MVRCISPVDGSVYVERPHPSPQEIDQAVKSAAQAQTLWRRVDFDERTDLCNKLVDAFIADRDRHAEELAHQMGRPIRYGGSEVNGFEERARCMIELAEAALSDFHPMGKEGFKRLIRHEPLGVVLTIAPWNYPYLTSVNSVIPALMAGNAVILKHSHQTPLCAERFVEAGEAAGLPPGLFQYLHLSPRTDGRGDQAARDTRRRLHRIGFGRHGDRTGGGGPLYSGQSRTRR
jgi:acyl-CoA reductase-like NAD-dependent aldehyde dehydrogenase